MTIIRHTLVLVSGLLASLLMLPVSQAAEVCGDGIDNNADGQADEGCWPAGVTGVCEQPLSCARGGAISPKTGNLVYRLPPDLTPKVPHGIGIAFQRVYMSQYEPGSPLPSTTDFKSPLGYGFQHNFMSWIEMEGGINDDVVLHTTTGQEVFLTYSHSEEYSFDSGAHFFTAQPGYHFKQVSVEYFCTFGICSIFDWHVTTLTGTTYEYKKSGQSLWKLRAIRAPGDAGDVIVTYNGSGSSGQVAKIEHETGNKYLQLEYDSIDPKLLRYVKYYTKGVTADDLRSTVEYVYSSGKLTTVKIGDVTGTMTTVQSYSYDSDGYLSLIEDGDGIDIAAFQYVDGEGGKVARLETGDGDVGYEYSPDPMVCTGTYVLYHRDSTTSCDSDAECGAGAYCGGQTDPTLADTGTCYKVRRCVESYSPNEDLITAVSAECEGGPCPSAVDVKEYDWETGDGDVTIELAGKKSADNVWTSYLYNNDGMVTQMVEGDNDSDASTYPSTARVTWYFYHSQYPGLVTEIRRTSELQDDASCSASISTDCMRTIYSYDSSTLKVKQVIRRGFTHFLSGGAPTTGSEIYDVGYTRNSYGQITQINGPLWGGFEGFDTVDFTYHSSGDPLLDGYVKEIKAQTAVYPDPETYLITTLDAYDHWGHPTEITRPDGTWSCLQYDGHRGFFISRREAMAGQTSCATVDNDDLEMQYTYDTWGRLTKIEKPQGNCVHYEYDAEGRLESVKPSDGCDPASGTDPHAIRHLYSLDGLLEKTEYSHGSTVTFRDERTYRPDRRLEKIINPESTSHHKLFEYDDDGMIQSIVHENSFGKDEFDYDALNRREEIRRYEDSLSFDTWSLTNALQLDVLLEVLDDDAKALQWQVDDFGRRIKQVSPDSGTTLWFYDEAGNVTKVIEAVGTAEEVAHDFAYDSQYRPTTSDFAGVDCGLDQEPEIQRAHDALPSGATCPTGASCANLQGRLAHVKTMMWCDSSEADDTFDQETFYAYDDAGRVIETFVIDDSGRTAKTTYSWDKNGNLLEIGNPLGGTLAYTYGGTSTDSDADRIAAVTNVVDDVRWWPFGPLKSYRQYNKLQGKKIVFLGNPDLAYRPGDARWEKEGSAGELFRIDWTLDEKGRVIVRDFTGGETDLQDAHYTFDDMDRIICDSGATGSCPTSGTDLKSNFSASDPYSASGERVELTHRSPVYGTDTYGYTYQTGSDQLDTVAIGTGTREVVYAFDERGNRASEDDSDLSNDKRDFTYDARGNLQTVRAKYKPTSQSSWRYFTITYAYDERNHRIFKSFYDEDSGDEAHWFYYYDLFDRLIGVKHVPDITDSSTFSLFKFSWLNRRPVHYVQTDYPGTVVTERYLHADELGRPLEAWSHPSSGNTARVWALNPDVFGWDDIILGESIYQPLRFPGQMVDEHTTAWADFESPARPPLHDNHHRVYDPFTGMYLQTDPEIATTWSSYGYAANDPVAKIDPLGRWTDQPGTSGGELPPPSWLPGGENYCLLEVFNPYCGGWDRDGSGFGGGGFGGGGATGDFDNLDETREKRKRGKAHCAREPRRPGEYCCFYWSETTNVPPFGKNCNYLCKNPPTEAGVPYEVNQNFFIYPPECTWLPTYNIARTDECPDATYWRELGCQPDVDPTWLSVGGVVIK